MEPKYIGLDVSKACLDVAWSTGTDEQVPNDDDGIASLVQRAKEAGIALEIMDTGAACRTFNVLTGEGRRVAAAVIPV